MKFTENNLLREETLVYETQLHWKIFIALSIYLFLGFVFSSDNRLAPLGTILFLLGLGTLISRIVAYKTSEFAVTNKRVIIKMGFIRRSSHETLLNKVEGIFVDQSILGRMLNYGTINVRGTGGSNSPFHSIKTPLEFRKVVQEQITFIQ